MTSGLPLVRQLAGAAARFGLRNSQAIQPTADGPATPQPSPPPPQGDHLDIAIGGDACASLLSACVAAAFKKSLALECRLPAEVLAMSGGGGRRQRTMLNAVVGTVPHARYLELGTRAPGTICAAMYDNVAYLTCAMSTSAAPECRQDITAACAPYRSSFIDLNFVDGGASAIDRHAIARSNILFMTWADPESEQFSLMPEVLDDEFILIADGWNSAAVREGIATAIVQASLMPVYDIAVRTTQDNSAATAAGPGSNWDQGCRIVVLRRTHLARAAT